MLPEICSCGITSSGAATVLCPGLEVPPFSPLYPVLSLSAMWLRELPLLQPCPAPHTAAGSQSAPSWGVSRFPLLPQGKRSQLPFSSSLSGLPHKVRLAREEEGEVISSPRDPGLNRLMVGRMLGSVCTCSPSRRACPLQHPECTWVCVVVMEHNMAPGGRGEDPVGSQTAGEGRRLGLWHVNTMGAREAPPPTGVRARPPLLAARPWRQDGAACSGMPPQACD